MKLLLITMLIIIAATVQAQEEYQEYNQDLDRTEYYDSHGLAAFSKENTGMNRTEYYDLSGNLIEIDEHAPAIGYADVYNGEGENVGHKEYSPDRKYFELYDKNNKRVASYFWSEGMKAWIKE